MFIEEEFQDFDKLLKKIDPIFLILIYIRIVTCFSRGFAGLVDESLLFRDDIYGFVNKRIKDLSSFEDIRKDILNGLLNLPEPHQYKLDILKIEMAFPKLILLQKVLQQLESDCRFANFCLSYSYPGHFYLSEHIKNYYFQIRGIENSPGSTPTTGFIVEGKEWLDSQEKKYKEEKKTEAFYKQALLVYRHNSTLLVNFNLIILYQQGGEDITDFCRELLYNYQKVQNASKTIIENKLNNEGFVRWLANYLTEKFPNFKVSEERNYDPVITDDDYKYIALQQLDYLFLLDEQRHQKLLKSIQNAWNKRIFDQRKREVKNAKITKGRRKG